jgi:hypothetical protein
MSATFGSNYVIKSEPLDDNPYAAFDDDDDLVKSEESDSDGDDINADGEEDDDELFSLQPLAEPSAPTAMLPPPPRIIGTTRAMPGAKKVVAAASTGNDTRRPRVNDVFVVPAASATVTAESMREEERAAQQQAAGQSSNVPIMETHTLNHYEVAKRLAAQQSVETPGAGLESSLANTSSKVGDSAAQVNHFLSVVTAARESIDPAILTDLPYVTKTSGAQLGRAFYMHGLTTAPHASRPVSENSEQVRRLASSAKLVRREHIEAMSRTPRVREEPCANGDGCVVHQFCDTYNRPLTKRSPLVAFLYEDELAQLRIDRPSIIALWKKRACIQCMICADNRLLHCLRFRNQALDAHNYLTVRFYVEVNVPGQYPIGATIGAGKEVFEGQLFNKPRFSAVDWMFMVRQEGGEEVIQYINTRIPPFPVPRETIEAYQRLGFSAAL